MLRYAAMIILTFMIGGTTVFAGYYFLNKVNVNKITLPELDAMQIVEITPLKAEKDEYGYIHTEFSDYTALQSNIGIDLLESKYATEQSYLQGKYGDRPEKLCNYKNEELHHRRDVLFANIAVNGFNFKSGTVRAGMGYRLFGFL